MKNKYTQEMTLNIIKQFGTKSNFLEMFFRKMIILAMFSTDRNIEEAIKYYFDIKNEK